MARRKRKTRTPERQPSAALPAVEEQPAGRLPIRLLTVLAAILLAHGVGLTAPLLYDDVVQITNNPGMRDWQTVWRAFVDPWAGFSGDLASSYRPLLYASFVFENKVADGATWPFRIVSLLSLAAFALVVGRYSELLTKRLAADADPARIRLTGHLAALLAAVHPLLNQAVMLASARASLWFATFGLLALARLLEERPRSAADTALVVLLVILALLSKESAVILLPLALLSAVLFAPRGGLRDALLATWPVVVPVLLYVLFHRYVITGAWTEGGGTSFPTSLAKQQTPLTYPAQGGLALLGLLRLLLLPLGMTPVHHLPMPTGTLREVGYAVWPVVAVLAALGWWRGGSARWAGFALGWFALAMSLSLVLVVLNTPFAEHRVVLAIVPALAFGGWWLAGWWQRSSWRRASAGAVLVLLAALAALQTWPWRDPVMFWTLQSRLEPEGMRAWSFLTDARLRAGDLDGAARAVQVGLQLAPHNALLLGHAGLIALARGEFAAARDYATRGLAVEQNLASLHAVMARVLALDRELDMATSHAERAVALDPENPDTWLTLGNVRLLSGDADGAAEAYRRVLEIHPGHSKAQQNLRRAERRARR